MQSIIKHIQQIAEVKLAMKSNLLLHHIFIVEVEMCMFQALILIQSLSALLEDWFGQRGKADQRSR